MAFWLLNYAHSEDRNFLSPGDLQQALSCASQRGWLNVLRKLVEIDADLINSHFGEKGLTALIVACITGNEATVRELIRLGADPNVKATDGSTALNAVAISKRTDLIDVLLRVGALPNDPDSEGWTALHHCAGNNDETGMQYVLKSGADPCMKTVKDGRTCAHEAALENSLKALKKLKRLRPTLDWNVENNEGYTPLHMAAWQNNHDIARLLVGYRCNIDKQDNMHRTALHIAIQEGGEETAKLLIDAGSSLLLCTLDGDTPLHYAAEYSHGGILKYMITKLEGNGQLSCLEIQNKRKGTALTLACRAGFEESTRILLVAGADFRAKGQFGASSLHYAAYSGNEKLAKLILGYSKDAQVLDNNKNTVLHYAARYNKPAFVNEYLKVCAQENLVVDLAAVNALNETALFRAVCEEHTAVIDILLQNTPATTYNIVTSDKNLLMHIAAWNGDATLFQTVIGTNSPLLKGWRDRSPLMCAIIGGKLDMVKYLMTSHSFDLNGKDQDGRTPLLLAIGHGRLDIARHLLQYEQDVNALDNDHRSALHLAAWVGDDDFFRLLLQKGCRAYNKERLKGRTPMHMAAARLSPVMVDLLLEFDFHNIRALDKAHRSVSFAAAGQGNIELLRRFKQLGIPLDETDSLGFNLAHFAANSGHLEALEYLANEGINIYACALDNTTPFLLAAANGYPNVVKYYIKQRPSVVKDIVLPSRATALIKAVHQRNAETAAILWQQDGLVDAIDAFGYTARDLSHPSLDHSSNDYTIPYETRRKMQESLIQTCLESLLAYKRLERTEDISCFLDTVSILAKALLFHGDFDLAKSLNMPSLFAEHYDAHFTILPECDSCMSAQVRDIIFVCRACYDLQILCKGCYDAYVDAAKDTPKALVDLAVLEKELRRIRVLSDRQSSVWDVVEILRMFESGKEFIATKIASYDRWEQTYQADINYRELERPGQTWVKLFQDCFDYLESKTNNDLELAQRKSSELQRRYQELLFNFKADRDNRSFRCKGHDYEEMNREDYVTVQKAGILYDPITGRPTQEMFRRIASRYGISDSANIETAHRSIDSVTPQTIPAEPDQHIADQQITGASALTNDSLLINRASIQEVLDLQRPQSHTMETGRQNYHNPDISIQGIRVANEFSRNQDIVTNAALGASTLERPRANGRSMSFDSFGNIAKSIDREVIRPPQRAYTDTMQRMTREYQPVEFVRGLPSSHKHQVKRCIQNPSKNTSTGDVQQQQQSDRGLLNANDADPAAGNEPMQTTGIISSTIHPCKEKIRTALEAEIAALAEAWMRPDEILVTFANIEAELDGIPRTTVNREAIINQTIDTAVSVFWIMLDALIKSPDIEIPVIALPETHLVKFTQILVVVLSQTEDPKAFSHALRLYEAMHPGYIYEFVHQRFAEIEAAAAAP